MTEQKNKAQSEPMKKMRIISNSALIDFGQRHKEADKPLQIWRKIIESQSFPHFAELKHTFNTVDKVGSFIVFDIGGNKYRIITAIHFDQQITYIRHVFTHKEYDNWIPLQSKEKPLKKPSKNGKG